MKEKKLTDEEIVKVWEYCIVRQGRCKDCPCGGELCKISNDDILDLIHRLQSENERLIKAVENFQKCIDNGEFVSKDMFNKQKAEIERLTEANLKYSVDRGRLLSEKDDLELRLKEQNATIKQLEKDFAIQRDKKVEWFKKANDVNDLNTKLHNENIELQKQVDKAWLEVGKMCMEERKDVAKEILNELGLFFMGTTFRKGYEFKEIDKKLKEIAKEKGVKLDNGD